MAPLTSSGCVCCCFITGKVGFDFSVFICGWTSLLFTGTEAGRLEDFGADFLYMDVGFFPVLKKAAPTKIFGLGFRLLKEMVIAFLDSAGLALLAGAAVVVGAGLAATLLNEMIAKTEQKINYTLWWKCKHQWCPRNWSNGVRKLQKHQQISSDGSVT